MLWARAQRRLASSRVKRAARAASSGERRGGRASWAASRSASQTSTVPSGTGGALGGFNYAGRGLVSIYGLIDQLGQARREPADVWLAHDGSVGAGYVALDDAGAIEAVPAIHLRLNPVFLGSDQRDRTRVGAGAVWQQGRARHLAHALPTASGGVAPVAESEICEFHRPPRDSSPCRDGVPVRSPELKDGPLESVLQARQEASEKPMVQPVRARPVDIRARVATGEVGEGVADVGTRTVKLVQVAVDRGPVSAGDAGFEQPRYETVRRPRARRDRA